MFRSRSLKLHPEALPHPTNRKLNLASSLEDDVRPEGVSEGCPGLAGPNCRGSGTATQMYKVDARTPSGSWGGVQGLPGGLQPSLWAGATGLRALRKEDSGSLTRSISWLSRCWLLAGDPGGDRRREILTAAMRLNSTHGATFAESAAYLQEQFFCFLPLPAVVPGSGVGGGQQCGFNKTIHLKNAEESP